MIKIIIYTLKPAAASNKTVRKVGNWNEVDHR